MTERLTVQAPSGLIHLVDDSESGVNQAIKKLYEYEAAEEEGRLAVLPCRTVYFIHNKAIQTKSILDLLLWEIDGIDKGGEHWSTREEAKKALKEMEGNHE